MAEIFIDKWGLDVVTGDTTAEKPNIALFENIREACVLLRKHLEAGNKVAVHCDVDTDGIGSGYIVKSMLKGLLSCGSTTFIINKDKIHGIQAKHYEYFNATDVALLIILDSSSNEIETIKQFSCDVLVFDHHEIDATTSMQLTGSTANGEYIIVNNVATVSRTGGDSEFPELSTDEITEYTPDDRMSGGLVVYEVFRLYCKMYGLGDLPEQLKLYQWAAVTLFSDAVQLTNARNQWYIENMISAYEIEPTLSILVNTLNSYKRALDKNFVNFSLSPIINAAVRGGAGLTALDIVLHRPSDVLELNKYKKIQDGILACREDGVEDLGSFVAKNLDGTGVPSNYSGVIATKLSAERGVCAIVYTVENNICKGSFRGTQQVDYRKYFESFGDDVYAQGHKPAFGFKVETTKLMNIMAGIKTVEQQMGRFYITAGDMPEYLRGVYHINSFDNFRKLKYLIRLAVGNSRVSSEEAINIIAYTSEIELVETRGKLYIYNVMGLTCKSFEVIDKSLVSIYAEFSNCVELYVKNINSWGLN